MHLADVALGLLETSSIAAGVRVADEVVKTADVTLLEAAPISPGKFLVLFTGGVAEVEASLSAGRRFAAGHEVDELFLPRLHAQVAPALGRRGGRRGGAGAEPGDAIGVVETLSVSSVLLAADAAAKAARIRLLEIAPGIGIGGKGFFTMAGDVASVQAAGDAARRTIAERGFLLHLEILAGPHASLAERVSRGLRGSFDPSAYGEDA
jgi:microcompartment protein CcmL/EutN